jgi:hypothetical protein
MGENFAMTMRETANRFNEEKDKAKRVRHEKYVEDVVAPMIEAVANNGGYSAHITIDTKYDWVMVKGLLTELGFSVGSITKFHTLYVAW